MRTALALFVHIGHDPGLRTQKYFCVVLEVHLHHFVRESEHDGMFGPHPLFDLDRAIARRMVLDFVVSFQLTLEVFQQCHFFVQLLGILCQSLLLRVVLSLAHSPFHLLKLVYFGIQHYFGRIIEENSVFVVRQNVS